MRYAVDSMLDFMDRRMEKVIRASAQHTGRRSFLAKLGTMVVGGAVLPLLPFERVSAAAAPAVTNEEDDAKCEYWAYCGIDGTLCNACGGTISQCPPGSEASKVSWVGTCMRAKDKKAYLVSYYDCCGKSSCQEEPYCSRHVGERPGYRIGTLSDMNWCMANRAKGVSCSTAVVVGVADSG
jgi:methylamine dehydrogenase light chain